MTSADQVVTAYDWIRGVSFSVAASIIGGASKLSIRKSWLIDVDLKRLKTATAFNIDEGEGCGVLVNEIAVKWTHRNPPPEYNASGDTVTHLNNDVVEKESAHKNSHLTPLEMTAPSSRGASASVPTPESLRQDVFSMEGGDDEELYDCQQHHDPTSIQQMKNISWFLYISGMIGMTFLNPLCCVLAMKYASPSILAPFSGLTLVWVILFSGMCVGEHPKLSQKVACTLIVLGEVMVALFGDHTNHEWNTYEEVVSAFQLHFAFEVGEGMCVFLICYVPFIYFRSQILLLWESLKINV